MRIPLRYSLPVGTALVLAGALLIFFFMNLEATRALLVQQLTGIPATETGAQAAVIQPIVEAETDDAALLHQRRGDMLALRGEWAEAQKEYQAAVDAQGGLTALRKLAQAELQRRDIRGVRATIDLLRREGARDEDILLLESIVLLRTGELTKARELLNAASSSPQQHYGLALLAIMAGNHEEAKKELLGVSDGWEPALRSYAQTLLAAYDEFALFPQSPTVHLQTLLGHALAEVQECEIALPMLMQVTTSQSDYRDAWTVQGFCELTTERFTEALASLERAYQIDPEKPEIQYFLARAYISLNDHGNAITFLQYALRNGFEPQTEIRQLLAKEALAFGNPSLAIEQYESLTSLPDASVETYVNYVTAAITAGRLQEASVKAEEAVKRWPEDAVALDLLGWTQMENGRREEAKTTLQRALLLNPALQSALEHLQTLGEQ